jgi:hypothetical protein
MVVVQVSITEMGVRSARVEAAMSDEDLARRFYARLKPELRRLSETIAEWKFPDGASGEYAGAA